MIVGGLMKKFDKNFDPDLVCYVKHGVGNTAFGIVIFLAIILASLVLGGCSAGQKDTWKLIHSGVLEDIEFSSTPATFMACERNYATVKFRDGTVFRLRDYHPQSVFKVGSILYMYQSAEFKAGYCIYSTNKKRGE